MKRKFVFEKKELSFIKRLRIPENRDLKNGLRLNRKKTFVISFSSGARGGAPQ